MCFPCLVVFIRVAFLFCLRGVECVFDWCLCLDSYIYMCCMIVGLCGCFLLMLLVFICVLCVCLEGVCVCVLVCVFLLLCSCCS